MSPFIQLRALAVGALLTACTTGEEHRSTGQDSPVLPGPIDSYNRRPQQPSPISTADAAMKSVPDAGATNFSYHFSGNVNIQKAYDLLSQDGVSDAAMDIACSKVPNSDNKLEICEVQEYSIAQYRKHPAAARAVYDAVLPMSLNDFDDKTEVDQKIRDRVKAAYEAIKALNVSQQILAMLYFVDFPKDTAFIERHRQELEIHTAKLRAEGLHDFHDYLFKNGGLGAYHFRAASEKVLSSQTALDAATDSTAERNYFTMANLLYAVFDEVGMNPRIDWVDLKYANPHNDYWDYKYGANEVRVTRVAVVSVPDGNRRYSIDGVRMDADVHFPESIEGSWRYYLGVHLSIQGHEQYHLRRYQAALEYFEQSLVFAPNSGPCYHTMGELHDQMGNKAAARAAYEKAVAIAPEYSRALHALGKIYWNEGNRPEAIQLFYRSVDADKNGWHPEHRDTLIKSLHQIGNEYYRKGDIKRAFTTYVAVLSADPEHQYRRLAAEYQRKLLAQELPKLVKEHIANPSGTATESEDFDLEKFAGAVVNWALINKLKEYHGETPSLIKP